MYDIQSFFHKGQTDLCLTPAKRSESESDGLSLTLDRSDRATCLFLRASILAETRFQLLGNFRFVRCLSGGWLLENRIEGQPSYWLPTHAILRRLNNQGHILEEHVAEWASFDPDTSGLEIMFSPLPAEWVLDAVIWRLDDPSLLAELKTLAPLETQGYFLLGSHTRYGKPADLYRHLIHSWVYENRYAWPFKRRICSENDAHALYVTLSGLEKATGKRLYRLLKEQLVLSVLARQGPDGAWRHGEWTDGMEAHCRLHASAMHLLMDRLAEGDDPTLRAALDRAARFIARQTDQTAIGTWFLHDELERSVETLKSGPFRWIPSRALGKSPSNMLVLNTHLDTSIALDRYRAMCGDETHAAVLDSARSATRAVLSLRPAETLYRILFKLIGLTLLPTRIAERLPIWQRLLKRIGWKYLIPLLPDIKTRFPRLVMPGGYIDRELSLRTWAHHYLSINLMDLARYRRRFPDDIPDDLLHDTATFAHDSGILQRWAELNYERYALGFWAEALYHLCLLFPNLDHYRVWLAEAMLLLEDTAQGLPPSLLGANAEALPPADQLPCPMPTHAGLRIANLGRVGRPELLVVNPSPARLELAWTGKSPAGLIWQNGINRSTVQPTEVPEHGWLWGRPLES